MPNIILTGDFNAPSVDWEKMEPKPNTNYGLDINHGMIDTIQEHSMTQGNPHPTREGNILDFVCATSPDLVNSVIPYPGMSDHEILITEMNITAKLTKKKPKTVLLYKRGNMHGIREDPKTLYEEEILPFKDEMSVKSM